MNPAVEAQAILQTYEPELHRIEHESKVAYWEAARTGSAESYQQYGKLEKELVEILSDPAAYARLARVQARIGEITDPLLRRQQELLYRRFRGCQGDKERIGRIVDLEQELNRSYNVFRAEYQGCKRGNNALKETLRQTEDTEEAREAWEALKQVGRLAAPRIQELVALRNEHARDLGASNYYALSLELGELDMGALFRLLSKLEAHSTALYQRLKRDIDTRLAVAFKVPCDALRPWHYRDPFFQEVPLEEADNLDVWLEGKSLEKLTETFFEGIGLPIRPILQKSDLYEKEGKDQHAFCMAVETPGDVRILCNLEPNGQWMRTMLHEFGHGVYDAGIDPTLPYLLRDPAHTLLTEAIAMLFERFARDQDFLAQILGMDTQAAEGFARRADACQAGRLLVFLRWVLVMTHFERSLYEDPAQDLCARWWEEVARFQWLNGRDRRTQPDWASKCHLATAPVYYQNYILGEVCASQIHASIREHLGGPAAPVVGNPRVGAFLQERIFRHGATLRWDDRLKAATGQPLSDKFFLEDAGQTHYG